MNGAGAAAISIARLLLKAGFKNITLCDRKGAIYEGRAEGMNAVKEEMSKVTNLDKNQVLLLICLQAQMCLSVFPRRAL